MTLATRTSLVGTSLAVAVAALVTCFCVAPSSADAPLRFDLVIHAVSGVAPDFIPERMPVTNELFAGASVAFDVLRTVPLDERHRVITTRADRDALGAYATRDAIDVFVVESLVDVDTPPLPRRGVHWRSRTYRGVRYVIVIAGSSRWVFPHELGHYFGNGHSDVPGNLMCYDRGTVEPFLDAVQLRRIRTSARSLMASRRRRD